MTTYRHIVQVHPVENGEVNLSKVRKEKEFDSKEEADFYINGYNANVAYMAYIWKRKENSPLCEKAVYLGRVNDITGELE
jgi:hypothetical protein